MKPNRHVMPDAVHSVERAMNRVAGNREAAIVLKAVSHPELGDIRIDDVLFAVGRDEAPFQDYPSEIVADLSRRHARIFSEYGAVYLADLDSKNGTAINGLEVRHKISRLQDGDEICFGRTLTYRVQLNRQLQARPQTVKIASLTLTPESSDAGLQPIVITNFPFLISKSDDTFARYKEAQPHQVNYISRRHAHIFLNGGQPYVEDLGSTNGTFVNGRRLDEHATALKDGDVLAFGGHHFVYKISLQNEERTIDPTVTMLSPLAAKAAERGGDAADKTTFVAAADSFLDIFCIDPVPSSADEENKEVAQENADGGKEARKAKARSRPMIFLSALASAFSGDEQGSARRVYRWGGVLLVLVCTVAAALYLGGASERNLQSMMDHGNYADAAKLADGYLQRDPGNAQYRAFGSDALLKAYVPPWLAQLRARDFRHAGDTLSVMKQLGSHNQDVLPLLSELEWVGNLEQVVMGRGGSEAPIRIYTDEAKIKALLAHWNDDTQGHQRFLDAIAAAVPQFKDLYAEALSHVRKLQSDDAVYLPAIERLKTSITSDLNDDHAEAIEADLKEYADKYPRIGGLDRLREDMRHYATLDQALRTQDLGALNAVLEKYRFTTPPFQAKLAALKSGSRFPPENVIAQYRTALNAWRAGDTGDAFAGLQKISAGPWADAAARQLAQKKSIAEQYTALQKSHGAKDYDERLLSFYGMLDPDEDTYFMRATQADMAQYKDKALAQAQDLLTQAQSSWQQYQKNGAIQGEQRLNPSSNQFKSQARLLSNANDNAQHGLRIYSQLKVDAPAEWRKVGDDIKAEDDQQRAALMNARDVLEPRVFKEKLALLGGPEK